MIYPCNTCLVDVMCLDVCDKFIWYMDEIAKTLALRVPVQRDHPIFEVLLTHFRYIRAKDYTLRYQPSTSMRLFTFLVEVRRQLICEMR